MTINLSSKYGCGGGGGGIGHATKDPRALPMTIATSSTLYLKYGENTSYADNTSGFWTYTNDIGYRVSHAPEDEGVYKTLVNWSNISGKIFNIITPVHDASAGTGEIKVKLTIDGTEYILGPSINTSRRNKRFIIGGVYPFIPETVDDRDYKGQMGSYNDSGTALYTAEIPYNISALYILDPLRYMMGGTPFLYFEDSFKCEILMNNVWTTGTEPYAGLTCGSIF